MRLYAQIAHPHFLVQFRCSLLWASSALSLSLSLCSASAGPPGRKGRSIDENQLQIGRAHFADRRKEAALCQKSVQAGEKRHPVSQSVSQSVSRSIRRIQISRDGITSRMRKAPKQVDKQTLSRDWPESVPSDDGVFLEFVPSTSSRSITTFGTLRRLHHRVASFLTQPSSDHCRRSWTLPYCARPTPIGAYAPCLVEIQVLPLPSSQRTEQLLIVIFHRADRFIAMSAASRIC